VACDGSFAHDQAISKSVKRAAAVEPLDCRFSHNFRARSEGAASGTGLRFLGLVIVKH
jgi:hypothetical protein